MTELNEVQNRDKALAILEEEGLEDSEWAILDQIQSLSNGLVPLEEQAMVDVEAGNLDAAQQAVFGHEYEDAVVQINDLTDKLISTVQGRLETASSTASLLQTISQVALLAAFLFIGRQFLSVIGFAERELLSPIEKVSAEMKNLAQGDFDQMLDLREDESEVGIMVSSIATMKKNNSGMIEEIAFVLGKMGDGNYNFTLEKDYATKADEVPTGGWIPSTTGTYVGNVIITALEANAPNGDNATFTASFEGVGALTKDSAESGDN